MEKAQPGFHYLKVKNGDTGALCEIYSEITIKTPDKLSLLLILKKIHILFDFEQEIAAGNLSSTVSDRLQIHF